MELELERILLRLIGRVDELENKVKTIEKQLDIKENTNDENSIELSEKINTNADIKRSIKFLVINELINSDDVIQLLSAGWCNEHLHLNFPMLRKIDDGKFDEKGYPRYWNTPFMIFGEEYYICSQWYPHNRCYFEKWLQEKLK